MLVFNYVILKQCQNKKFYILPKERILAANNAGHGSRSQYNVSIPVKYKVKHKGHKSEAFNRPISEKNNET